MQAQAALVGADGAVVLHAVAAVDTDHALVIDPRHTEGDDALGLDEALQQTSLLVLFFVAFHNGFEVQQDLGSSLEELRLMGITDFQIFKNTLGIASHREISFQIQMRTRPPQNHIDGNILPGNLQDCNRNPALTMFFYWIFAVFLRELQDVIFSSGGGTLCAGICRGRGFVLAQCR